ncbi:hypothetical protein V1523DRAFT_397991 [Lipomyces doorenjongii]
MKKIPYSHAVGSLIYAATHTLPDIATANSGWAHWVAVKRTFRWLRLTSGHGLVYQRDSSLLGSNMRLCGYSDSAWAGCADAKRSTLGYAFLLPTGLISWNAGSPKLRREYIFPTEIYEDNQSCIAVVNNPRSSRTGQNIELRVLKGLIPPCRRWEKINQEYWLITN